MEKAQPLQGWHTSKKQNPFLWLVCRCLTDQASRPLVVVEGHHRNVQIEAARTTKCIIQLMKEICAGQDNDAISANDAKQHGKDIAFVGFFALLLLQ